MKNILHSRKKDVFGTWLNDYFLEKKAKYIWAQLCYDWNTGELIHVVFEKNTDNEAFVEWPVKVEDLPFTNIDFTGNEPVLDDGSPWDYYNWHKEALGCELQSSPKATPESFWDWRLQTRPKGNATCDLDFLAKTVKGEYIGIEATEIYYVDESSNINQDVFEHFQRLLRLRRGNRPGFNTKQLKAQKQFVEKRGGRMFMLFHQILKNQTPYKLRDDRCLLLEITDSNLNRIESIINYTNYNQADPMDGIKQEVHFASLKGVLDRFLD